MTPFLQIEYNHWNTKNLLTALFKYERISVKNFRLTCQSGDGVKALLLVNDNMCIKSTDLPDALYKNNGYGIYLHKSTSHIKNYIMRGYSEHAPDL